MKNYESTTLNLGQKADPGAVTEHERVRGLLRVMPPFGRRENQANPTVEAPVHLVARQRLPGAPSQFFDANSLITNESTIATARARASMFMKS